MKMKVWKTNWADAPKPWFVKCPSCQNTVSTFCLDDAIVLKDLHLRYKHNTKDS